MAGLVTTRLIVCCKSKYKNIAILYKMNAQFKLFVEILTQLPILVCNLRSHLWSSEQTLRRLLLCVKQQGINIIIKN